MKFGAKFWWMGCEGEKQEPMTRIELVTPSLPRKYSTPELHRQLWAGDGTQTRDPQLGRLMLYQLSYSRLLFFKISVKKTRHTIWLILTLCGERRIRTSEVVRQQIYSLPHLAALESPQNRFWYVKNLFLSRMSDSNWRPRDYKSRALANWANSASG